MHFLIFFMLMAVAQANLFESLVPPPVILPSGHLQDTYEVQQAKANFFNQYNKALVSVSAIPQSSPFNPSPFLSDFTNTKSPITSKRHLDTDAACVAEATVIYYRDIARRQGAPTAQYDTYLKTYFGRA